MTAKHTPGPWTANAPSEDIETRHWTIRAPGSGSMVSFEVARISGRSATDPHTARLIAAAPELLAALEAARRLIELISPLEGAVTRQIDAAIAKATGGEE